MARSVAKAFVFTVYVPWASWTHQPSAGLFFLEDLNQYSGFLPHTNDEHVFPTHVRTHRCSTTRGKGECAREHTPACSHPACPAKTSVGRRCKRRS